MTLRSRLISLFLVASIAWGASASADPVAALPAEGRVVLAPLNLGIRLAPELAQGVGPVWDELLRHFETRNPPPVALAPEGAAALWAEVVKAGSASEHDVYAAYARFARRVAEQAPFDAMVIAALVVRAAKVDGYQASWDGVVRGVDAPPIGTPAGLGSGIVQVRSRGALSAASLHVAILSPEGELRFEGAGGLALLQRLERREGHEGEELAVVDRPAPFADADALREGVRTAFERPLPASRAR